MQVIQTHLRPAAATYAPTRNGNPGVVPPWLQHSFPADPTPRAMGHLNPTVYDPAPVEDPDQPWHIEAQPQLWIPGQPEPDPWTPHIM